MTYLGNHPEIVGNDKSGSATQGAILIYLLWLTVQFAHARNRGNDTGGRTESLTKRS
jgi:hypothetical protein